MVPLNVQGGVALVWGKEIIMTYIEPTPTTPQPEIQPETTPQPEIQPSDTPDEVPPMEPGGGDEGDSRPYDAA